MVIEYGGVAPVTVCQAPVFARLTELDCNSHPWPDGQFRVMVLPLVNVPVVLRAHPTTRLELPVFVRGRWKSLPL